MARGITTEQGVACRFSGFVAALRSITPGSLGSGLRGGGGVPNIFVWQHQF